MKTKWVMPFMPLVSLALPPPADPTIRVLFVVAMLVICGVYLSIVQPWKPDEIK